MGRVCRSCRTRFVVPSPRAWGIVVAVVLTVPALLFSAIAIAVGFLLATEPVRDPNAKTAGLLCSGVSGAIAFVCFLQVVRELRGAGKRPREGVRPASPVLPPPLLSKKLAVELLVEIAERHGLKGIVQKVGAFPESHLANAARTFAEQLSDDETPLTFVDRSFLGNGKAGFLVTNRGLYSSLHRNVIWIEDIREVSYLTPGWGDHLLAATDIGKIYLLLHKFRPLQNRLLVNGKLVYASGKPLSATFWIEWLTGLGIVAREWPALARCRVVLETSHYRGEGEPAQTRQVPDPTWEQVEQGIRDLDPYGCPSVRLSTSGAEKASTLEILGGKGKYALREPHNGWVYYDPSRGNEEVEVCTSGQGYRCAAFYVCTDLDRVVSIARCFIETGAFE